MEKYYIIQSILELAAVVAVIYGLFNEEYIAEAERQILKKWRVKK